MKSIKTSFFLTTLLFTSVGWSAELALDSNEIAAIKSFVMARDLVGAIQQSSEPKEIGETFTFIALDSEKPRVMFHKNGNTSPLTKVFEDENTLTLILIASGSGSLDAFVIDKKTGKFARVTAGNFLGTHASASLGACK